MTLNYLELIIGSLCLIIIGFCAGVVIHAGEIIPYQPLIVGLIALGGAVIAYVGTLRASHAHLQVAEKNIKHQQEQKALDSINEKQEIASFAQKLLLEIFNYLVATSLLSRDQAIDEKWLNLLTLKDMIERYVTRMEDASDKFMKLDINNSSRIHLIIRGLKNILPEAETIQNINQLMKTGDNGAICAQYINRTYEYIGTFLNENVTVHDILNDLDVISKGNVDQSRAYSILTTDLRKIINENLRLIQSAVTAGRYLEIDYPPGRRVVAPHILGRTSSGELVLSVYQVNGASDAGETVGWKTFHLDRILGVRVLDKRFSPQGDYNPHDPKIPEVIVKV